MNSQPCLSELVEATDAVCYFTSLELSRSKKGQKNILVYKNNFPSIFPLG